MLLKNPVQGRVNALPLGEQRLQDGFAFRGEAVKPLVALVFLAPFADQKALALQASQERIQGAFINGHAVIGERFSEGIAVLFGAKHDEDGENERAAAELETEIFEERVVVVTGRHIVYGIHCVAHRLNCQVLFSRCWTDSLTL